MILVILGVVLAIAVVGFILYSRTDEEVFFATGVGGATLSLIAFAALLIFAVEASVGNHIPEKIKMYEQENQKIEQNISEVIDTYITSQVGMQKELIEKVNNSESSVVIIAAFPDINASEAIKAQVEIYQENNKKIKDLLKEGLIDLSVKRWWLYFGH